MRKLVLDFLLFSVPFLVFMLIIIIVDPYDYFNVYNGHSPQFKKDLISKTRETTVKGNLIRQLNLFEENGDAENLIIGASRSDKINLSQVYQLTEEKYVNLSFPGANLTEICEMFWKVVKKRRLYKVYISLNFDVVNDKINQSRISEITDIKWYSYFTDQFLVKQAFNNLVVSQKKSGYAFQAPKTTGFFPKGENDFTFRDLPNKNQKFEKGKKLYRNKNWLGGLDRFPSNHMKALTEISEYCEQNNIELNFICFPSNQGMLEVIAELQLIGIYTKFKNKLTTLGNLYDFEYLNEITRNNDLYSDLCHTDQYTIERIVHEIWSQEFDICRYSPQSSK